MHYSGVLAGAGTNKGDAMATQVAYFWISPRGFANEGRVYTVPAEQAETALATLDSKYGANPDANYYQVDGREAHRKALKEYGGWAHTQYWDHDAPVSAHEDNMRASEWLWTGDSES
jgi:hypothetical protein